MHVLAQRLTSPSRALLGPTGYRAVEQMPMRFRRKFFRRSIAAAT
jgi:hypothetical protein